MKLILANEEAIEVSRVNESMAGGNKSLNIGISSEYAINDLNEILEGNTETIVLQRENGSQDISFTGYAKVMAITRDITEYDDTVRITLGVVSQ